MIRTGGYPLVQTGVTDLTAGELAGPTMNVFCECLGGRDYGDTYRALAFLASFILNLAVNVRFLD